MNPSHKFLNFKNLVNTLPQTKTLAVKIYYAFFLCLMFSCSKHTYDSNYPGQDNFSNFYVVDTIKIIDPVRIHSSKFGGQFIISKKLLKDYDGKSSFFSRPDVFFLGSDFYRDLPQKDYKKYSYPDYGGCSLLQSLTPTIGLEVFEFKHEPKYFILCLINANYFYQKHMTFDMKPFAYHEKNNKIIYYKIVYPLCQ